MGLIDRLPSFYSEVTSVVDIQNSLDEQRILLELRMKELEDELFVITSCEIEKWELFMGIAPDVTKSLEFRKTNIISKIRGKGTTTIELINNVSASYSNAEVEVIEDNSKNKFTIKFVGQKGIPPNLEDLKKAIEEIKPAHLEVLYEFVYNSWSMISNLNWAQCSTNTWESLRVR